MIHVRLSLDQVRALLRRIAPTLTLQQRMKLLRELAREDLPPGGSPRDDRPARSVQAPVRMEPTPPAQPPPPRVLEAPRPEAPPPPPSPAPAPAGPVEAAPAFAPPPLITPVITPVFEPSEPGETVRAPRAPVHDGVAPHGLAGASASERGAGRSPASTSRLAGEGTPPGPAADSLPAGEPVRSTRAPVHDGVAPLGLAGASGSERGAGRSPASTSRLAGEGTPPGLAADSLRAGEPAPLAWPEAPPPSFNPGADEDAKSDEGGGRLAWERRLYRLFKPARAQAKHLDGAQLSDLIRKSVAEVRSR